MNDKTQLPSFSQKELKKLYLMLFEQLLTSRGCYGYDNLKSWLIQKDNSKLTEYYDVVAFDFLVKLEAFQPTDFLKKY